MTTVQKIAANAPIPKCGKYRTKISVCSVSNHRKILQGETERYVIILLYFPSKMFYPLVLNLIVRFDNNCR